MNIDLYVMESFAMEAAGDRKFEKSKESPVMGIQMVPDKGVIVKLTKGSLTIKLGQPINDELKNDLNAINYGIVGAPIPEVVSAKEHKQLTPGIHVRDYEKKGLVRKHSGRVTEIVVDVQGAEKSIPVSINSYKLDTFMRAVKWFKEVDGDEWVPTWNIKNSGLYVYSGKMHLCMEPREMNTKHPKVNAVTMFVPQRANYVGSITLYDPEYFDATHPRKKAKK